MKFKNYLQPYIEENIFLNWVFAHAVVQKVVNHAPPPLTCEWLSLLGMILLYPITCEMLQTGVFLNIPQNIHWFFREWKISKYLLKQVVYFFIVLFLVKFLVYSIEYKLKCICKSFYFTQCPSFIGYGVCNKLEESLFPWPTKGNWDIFYNSKEKNCMKSGRWDEKSACVYLFITFSCSAVNKLFGPVWHPKSLINCLLGVKLHTLE